MQTSDISVVMFDDESGRKSILDLLEKATGYETKFVDLQGKPVITEVVKVLKNTPPPNLVLVDHILNTVVGDSSIRKGSSIVPLMREKWPEAPIIAVTAAKDECTADVAGEVYEDIVAIKDFSSFVAYVPSIISGYTRIRGVNSLEDLTSALSVPDSEQQALIISLPPLIKSTISKETVAHHIFRWFRSKFYRQPGFLWNRDWAALALGVSPEYYDHYKAVIDEAAYKGIFADGEDPRWWKTTVYSLLLPESTERFTVQLNEAAASKLAINTKHVSKCYRCGEKWPEVMGYVDEASRVESEQKPFHRRCSKAHSLSSAEPFYEERRVMLEDE